MTSDYYSLMPQRNTSARWFDTSLVLILYHRQQINVTPNGVYLPISKLHSILAVANLLAHNNKSQICYCGQISLECAAVNYNLIPSGGNIYFAGDGTMAGTGRPNSNGMKKYWKKSITTWNSYLYGMDISINYPASDSSRSDSKKPAGSGN